MFGSVSHGLLASSRVCDRSGDVCMRTVAFTSSMSVSACMREMLTSFPSAAVLLLLRTGSAGKLVTMSMPAGIDVVIVVPGPIFYE